MLNLNLKYASDASLQAALSEAKRLRNSAETPEIRAVMADTVVEINAVMGLRVARAFLESET